jgi:hypothetical protein
MGLAEDSGILYIADASNRILQVNTSSGAHSIVAGTGKVATDIILNETRATNISLKYPWGITLDPSGNIYFSDSLSHVVRLINRTTGNVSVIAGNGTARFGGDGFQATVANLNRPTGITIDRNLNILIADCENHRIRKVSSLGIISTVAGSGNSSRCDAKSGPATMISLRYPTGVAVDSDGNLYIADTGHNLIRKVNTTTGMMTIIAGSKVFPQLKFFPVDFSLNLNLSIPTGILINSLGQIIFADYHGKLYSMDQYHYPATFTSVCHATLSEIPSYCLFLDSDSFQCASNHWHPTILFTPIKMVLFYNAADSASYNGTGQTVYDLSGKNNHGVLSNPSVIGGGFYFRGQNSDYLIASSMALTPTEAEGILSYEYWLKPTATVKVSSCASWWNCNSPGGLGGENHYKYGSPSSLFVGFGFAFGRNGLVIGIHKHSHAPLILQHSESYTSVSHLVVVKGVNNCWYYVNGVLKATSSTTSFIIGDTMRSIVGSAPSAANSFSIPFAGTVYSVKFYNQLLSAEEVRFNFESTKNQFGL